MTERILIKNTHLFLENKTIYNGYLLIEAGKIGNISEEQIEVDENVKRIDGTNLTCLPGFIDSHIHGAKGQDTMDARASALETIAMCLPREGTTSFVATTMTQSKKKIEAALLNIGNYENKQDAATLLGAHLEGPFIHPEKAGAHQEQYMIQTSKVLWKKWQQLAKGKIKTITIAPECDADHLIPYLANQGINVSLGHSTVGYEAAKVAVENGVTQLTHLANAMTGIHHRDVGAVGAAFLMDELKVELIADGIHMCKEMLEISYKQIGSDRIILITDAMRAKGLHDGTYELGGQTVSLHKKHATLYNGTLAGSVQTMIDNVKTMLTIPTVTLRDIMKMTAENPAKQLHVYDKKGSIAIGKDADIVLLDEKINVMYTICEGKIVYRE